jgi:outer membrane protein OmpA-like peptidoglycan-associated protein
VPNGNFKQYKKCPTHYSINDILYEWFSPSKGTPNYFNECGRNGYGAPNNFAGGTSSHSGKGYVGSFLAGANLLYKRNLSKTQPGEYNSREILEVKLKQPLVENKKYCVKLYVKLSSWSNFKIDQIDLYFSERKRKFRNIHQYDFTPQVRFKNCNFNKSSNWTLLCTIFQPESNHRYMLLGNFKKTTKLNIERFEISEPNKKLGGGFYYFDDISVTPISDKSNCNCSSDSMKQVANKVEQISSDSIFPDSIKVNEPVILNNIHFKLDKATLLPASYPELNKLYRLMQRNSGIEINIAGHTDSTGTENYNKGLSVKRAQAVAEYLKEKGIDTSRVSYKGYGNTRPIATDSTEAGRAKNRRVEFIIKKR